MYYQELMAGKGNQNIFKRREEYLIKTTKNVLDGTSNNKVMIN